MFLKISLVQLKYIYSFYFYFFYFFLSLIICIENETFEKFHYENGKNEFYFRKDCYQT